MRTWISIALLALAVAGLAAWLYYHPRPGAPGLPALSDLAAAQVERIRIVRGHDAGGMAGAADPTDSPRASHRSVMELEKGPGGWRLTAPFAARAEASQVARVLSILEARPSARYPATDLGRYGLDAPLAELTLADQTFSFGAVNTITREQYVLTRDAVYAIALAQRHALPRDANALVSRSLFAPDEVPVRIELPQFTAALADGAWAFTPPAADAGADARNAWADHWRHATALAAARHDGHASAWTVVVTLQGGRRVEIGITRLEAELVLVRRDEGVQFHFLPQVANKMLSPPGTG